MTPDSLVLLGGIGGGEHDRGLRLVCIGDPRLGPVQDPVIPFQACCGPSRPCQPQESPPASSSGKSMNFFS